MFYMVILEIPLILFDLLTFAQWEEWSFGLTTIILPFSVGNSPTTFSVFQPEKLIPEITKEKNVTNHESGIEKALIFSYTKL